MTQLNQTLHSSSYLFDKIRKVGLSLVSASSMLLVACGGGTGGVGTQIIPSTSTTTTTSSGTATSTTPVITVTVKDTALANTYSVAAGGTVRASAVLTTSTGAAIPNTLVTFTMSSTSYADFSPASGTSLTDSTGTATISILAKAPNPGGAFTVSAGASVGAAAIASSPWGINVSAANVSLSGGVGSSVPLTSALPSGSSTTLSVPVNSGGNPVNSGVTLAFSSPCAGATPPLASITPIGLTNGIYTATYKNLGCQTSPDVVSVTQVGGSAATSVSIPVASSNLGEIRFESVSPISSSLVVKNAGGYGRVEVGVVTFKVVDSSGNPIANVPVSFSLSSVAGGINLVSTTATTLSDGRVTATVNSGKVPTPVVVMATAVYQGATLSAASSVINISVGLPEQRGMSLSPVVSNIEGWSYDGVVTKFTAFLSDFWGNKVADGTTVNMITEGGVIGSSSSGACNTLNGTCSLDFASQAFRPANGRASLSAYTLGPYSFVDTSGTGDFTVPGNTCFHTGDPFIDYDESGVRSASPDYLGGVTRLGPTAVNYTPTSALPLYPSAVESFVPYSGSSYMTPASNLACGAIRPLTYVHKPGLMIFSGSQAYGASPATAATLTWPLDLNTFNGGFAGGVVSIPKTVQTSSTSSPNAAGAVPGTSVNNSVAATTITTVVGASTTTVTTDRFACPAGYITINLFDLNLNPLPANSSVAVLGSGISATSETPIVRSATAVGGTQHSFSYTPDATQCGSNNTATIAVKVTTPFGNQSIVIVPLRY